MYSDLVGSKRWLLVIICVLGAFAASPAAADNRLTIASGGIARGQIVIADKPDPIGFVYDQWWLDRTRNTRYAAEFLQDYIRRVTGATVPIVTASRARYSSRPKILVGRSELTDFVEQERQALEPEGYLIRREGAKVAIVGEIAGEDDLPEYRGADRGTLFGVYRFIEETLGVRWYFAGPLGTVVPEQSALTVFDLDITEAPHFRMRTGALRDRRVGEGEEPSPYDSIHPAIRPGNTTGFMTNHSSNDWHRYAEDHPEVFAVDADGELMADPDARGVRVNRLNYLHPKTLEIDMQRVRDFYERDRRYWAYSIMPNSRYVRFFPRDLENVIHDQSEESRALWTPERENSKLSEIIHGYAARFAEQLAKEYPDKRLAFGAYAGFLKPPQSVEMPDNADVMIATVKGNSKLVSPGHWEHNTRLVEDWFEHLGEDRNRVFLWEYLRYPNHRLQLYPYTMQRWFQFCKDKVMGAFNNGFTETRQDHWAHFRLSLLNGWLWHQLLWDPDADVDALLAGFYNDLFGPASEPMGALFDLAIDTYENAPFGPSVNPGAVSHVRDRSLYRHIYDADFVAAAREHLAAAREAAPEGSIYAERVEYFGEAFEDKFDDADRFHQADGQAPTTRVPAAPETPNLDALLDDPVWRDAVTVELRGRRMAEDSNTQSPSLVYLLHDDEALLIAARLGLRDPEAVRQAGSFRDDPQILRDDAFGIDIDLREQRPGEPQEFYRIRVNAAGHVADGTAMVPFVRENRHWSNWNELWNPEGVEVVTAMQNDGWSVAMRVPLCIFPELHSDAEAEMSLPVQFVQQLTTGQPRTLTWSPMFIEPYEYDLSRMGTLTLERPGSNG